MHGLNCADVLPFGLLIFSCCNVTLICYAFQSEFDGLLLVAGLDMLFRGLSIAVQLTIPSTTNVQS